MRRYRLYTEDKDRKWLESLFNLTFDGFTVYKTVGFWNGVKENSLVFEVLDSREKMIHQVRAVARIIKRVNKQQAVLITHEEIKGELI